MKNDPRPPVDETELTEITIQPDGRVYVFGASRNVLGLLAALQPNDGRLRRLIEAANAVGARPSPQPAPFVTREREKEV